MAPTPAGPEKNILIKFVTAALAPEHRQATVHPSNFADG